MAATAEQMQEVLRQLAQMATQQQQMSQQLEAVATDSTSLKQQVDARDHQIKIELDRISQEAVSASSAAAQAQFSAHTGNQSGGSGGDAAFVSKWAPDFFSGKQEDWAVWSTKFRSFIGAMKQGQVGTWMDWVNEKRNQAARNEVLGQEAIATSSMLHSALVHVCQGKAIAIVNKAGLGQGLEA